VKTFGPYKNVNEVNFEARAAAKALVDEGRKAGPKRKTFIFVNNRLEGNARATIAGVMEVTSSLRKPSLLSTLDFYRLGL
jgi:hypothetical protein